MPPSRSAYAYACALAVLAVAAIAGCRPPASRDAQPTATIAPSSAPSRGDAAPSATIAASATPARDDGGTAPAERDYRSLGDILRDGPRAIGETALLMTRRAATDSARIYAHSCGDKGMEHEVFFDLAFDPGDRDRVRAIPVTLEQGRTCVPVRLTITGFDPRSRRVQGKALSIAATPVPPRPPPKGADYASLEDAALDGARAEGKIVEFRGYSHHDGLGRLFPCDDPEYEGGGGVMVQLGPKDQAKEKKIDSHFKRGSIVRVKIGPPSGEDAMLAGELIEVR